MQLAHFDANGALDPPCLGPAERWQEVMDSHRDIRSGEAGPASMSLWRLACRTAFHELGNGGVYCIAIWPAWGHIIASQDGD